MTFQAAVMLEVTNTLYPFLLLSLPFSVKPLNPNIYFALITVFLLFYKNQMEDYSVIINQAHSVLRAA